MSKVLILVLANLAIAFAGLPLPADLRQRLFYLTKEDPPAIGRVVGGTPATDGQRPYQIILKRSGRFSCGGSLIGSKTVLTAAHCVDGYVNRVTIVQNIPITNASNLLKEMKTVPKILLSLSTLCDSLREDKPSKCPKL